MNIEDLTYEFLYDEHINKHKTVFQIGKENGFVSNGRLMMRCPLI